MPTESLVAVKIPAEVAAPIDRVSKNRQRFVVAAIVEALARWHSIEGETPEEPEAWLHHWQQDSIREWAEPVPESEIEGLFDANGGTPVKWVEGVGFVQCKN